MRVSFEVTQDFLHKFGFYGDQSNQQWSAEQSQPRYTSNLEKDYASEVGDTESSDQSPSAESTTSIVSLPFTSEESNATELTEHLEQKEDSLSDTIYDKTTNLLAQIPKRKPVQTDCSSLRGEAVSCYNQNQSNILSCGTLVDRFFNCANEIPSEDEF